MKLTSQPQRRDRLLKEQVHDPYVNKQKIKEPAACPDCGAVYRKGAWHWEAAPENTQAHSCPACKRVRDRLPAGYLSLRGDYFAGHRDEILNLVDNIATQAKQSHPLKRIMNIETSADETLITLTDTHLTREIGDAINKSQGGNLDVQYGEGSDILRVFWQRE